MEHTLQEVIPLPTDSSSAMSAASGMHSFSWILDSGATHHISSDALALVNLYLLSPPSCVCTNDRALLSITQCGRITPTSLSSPQLLLFDVYYVPRQIINLIFVS